MRRLSACLVALVVVASSVPAAAQDAAAFYKDKTITVLGPFGAEGNYGVLVRLLALHLPKHLAGAPSGIPQFMPGAGGVKQANYLYNAAPRTGTMIGLLYDNMPTAQALQSGPEMKFDARKFEVLGSVNKGENGVLAVMASAPATTVDAARMTEVVLGASGTSSAQYQVPHMLNKVAGTRFKLVPGYKSVGEIFLAMERGEVAGVFTGFATFELMRPQWISEGKYRWVFQHGDEADPKLPQVPMMSALAKDPLDRDAIVLLGRSRSAGKVVVAPPGTPADRLAALREAFARTMRDPTFIAEARKVQLDVMPRDWQSAKKIVDDTVNAAPAVVARTLELMKVEK